MVEDETPKFNVQVYAVRVKSATRTGRATDFNLMSIWTYMNVILYVHFWELYQQSYFRSFTQVPVVSSQDYGKDEDSAEALLKRHEGLMADLEAYGNTIDGLREQAQACKVSRTMRFVFKKFGVMKCYPLSD